MDKGWETDFLQRLHSINWENLTYIRLLPEFCPLFTNRHHPH